MNAIKKTVEQVRAVCRCYPDKLTASEVVGRIYLLLQEIPGLKKPTAFLAEQLDPQAQAKLSKAACEVFGAYDSFSAVQGFKLGAVVVPAGKAAATTALEERLIPGAFVKDLMNCERSATGRFASGKVV